MSPYPTRTLASMAILENKPEGNGDASLSFRWGTWEELLLAYAVNRHGTGAWASIASEMKKRSSGQNLSLTAQNCRQKYIDLKRRYVMKNSAEFINDDDLNDGEIALPLLEELRKLRVTELRLEVRRYDLNIESLESKIKRMEEDRERSTTKEKIESDLDIKNEEIRDVKDVEEDVKPLPEPLSSVKFLAAVESEKDRMSVNESNSSDLGSEKLRISTKGSKQVVSEDAVDKIEKKKDMKSDSAREDSCNGSSNSIEKESAAVPTSDSRDLMESEESNGGDDAMKETSDVQSAASRSTKEGSDKVRRGGSSGVEPDRGVQSCSLRAVPAQSQPLIDFLQVISAHKLGSTFHRRLRSQESSKYQKMILQHVDLETIETRLMEGWYSGSTIKFFHDLLLLVNNALVFFRKNSSEARAALEIRQLISNEMSQLAKSESSFRKQISQQSPSISNKEDHDSPHSLSLKPRISGSLIACRKRSSIAAKASLPSSCADNKKKEQIALIDEEKDSKIQHSQLSDNAEEPKITNRRTRNQFPSDSVNSKKNNKNQGNGNSNKNPAAESGKQQGKGGSSSLQLESKGEKRIQPTIDSKKRRASNFLNRMKQSSSSNNGVLLDALKNIPLTRENTKSKGGSQQKKDDNAKLGEKRDHVTRRSSETKQAKGKGSPVKRNVGRPPKKGAPPPALGKRGRETSETEIASSKKPKKRSRKL